VATRPSTRSTPSRPAQKRPAAAKGSKKAGSRRPPAKASTRAKARAGIGPGPLRRLFDGRGHDVWGLVLLALAAVAALGIWAGRGAIVGGWADSAAGALVGLLRVLVPVGLAGAGLLLIRGPRSARDLRDRPRAAPDEADTRPDHPVDERTATLARRAARPPAPRPASIAVGSVVLALVALGFAHLFAANDATISADGVDAYRGAGGLLGAGVGGGLARVIGPYGAGLVLAVVAVLGVSLLSGWSLGQMWHGVVDVSSPPLRRLGEWLANLFSVGSHGDDAAGSATDAADHPHLYDQDADAAAPKRSRRRKQPAPPEVRVGDGAGDAPVDTTQLGLALGPAAEGSPWKLPSLKLLSVSGKRTVDSKAVEARGRVLESALADHGVQTRLVGMVVGPTVTRYELELGVGVKVAKLTSLNRDIAYAMASPDVRIIAPIPGRQAIGVEVPNSERQIVAVGDILVSEEAHRATHPLEVAVGRDINGRPVLMNLATMPHLLIAGQTGAGKSSCINSIITSVMMRSTPEQVRMILVDPKRVELTQYDRIPHLLTQVVANPKKAANALAWAVKEMERRYDLLSEVGVRDITGFNAAVDRGDLAMTFGEDREFKRLPFILIVVDELSDLMMVAPRDVEDAICRIAQMARAVGIHLVIATQRPSVNVITGVIKANIPARLAFAVASATDSKVILDQGGAEKLVGQGDMLLLGPASSAPQRIQGAWVEEKEVHAIVGFWRKQSPNVQEQYVEGVEGTDDSTGPGGHHGGSGDDDDLLVQAMELVVRSQLGSTSMLQRKLKVGFARAGRLMDLLEQRGVVGPSEGSKARDVLMTVEEFENMAEAGEV